MERGDPSRMFSENCLSEQSCILKYPLEKKDSPVEQIHFLAHLEQVQGLIALAPIAVKLT